MSSSNASGWAVTTTYTGPASCTYSQFTMMAASSYYVYMNYPDPVGTETSTHTECYPSQFISSYFSQKAAITPLPAIEPLICPKGYQSISSAAFPNGYVACCPSGMGLATSDNAPGTRPAFNATCYTDIVTPVVTAYGTASITATSTWSAPSGAQAYGLPIEGYAYVVQTATSNSSSTETATSSPTSSVTASAAGNATATETAQPSSSSSSSSNHTGAIVGGTIGGIAGLALIIAAIFFLLRRSKTKNTPQQTHHEADAAEVHEKPGRQTPPTARSVPESTFGRSEMESKADLADAKAEKPDAPHELATEPFRSELHGDSVKSPDYKDGR